MIDSSEQDYVSPEEREEQLAMMADMPIGTGNTPSALPTSVPQYSPEVKEVTYLPFLQTSMVIAFEALHKVTQEGNPDKGALLLWLADSNGEVQDVWLPKKLCSNLDLTNRTVLVWDVIMKEKIADLGGLAYEPEYAAAQEGKEGAK